MKPSDAILALALVLALLPGCGDDSEKAGAPLDTGGFGGVVFPAATGGAQPSGGAPGYGGATTGSGGLVAIGAGGFVAAGGTTALGGAGAGGVGGADGSGGAEGPGGAGGAGAGGAVGTGGSPSCEFPTSFRWSSSGPLAEPKSPPGHNFVSLKDFTVVRKDDQYVVYATVFDKSASWHGVNFNFTDWSQAGAAPQTYMGNTPTGGTVAPTLFYFTPKSVWVLTYQWGFKYATSPDPTQPSMWSTPRPLLSGDPTNGTGTGPIDQTVICDTANCYLFFAGDNGHIYRGSMPIGSFPGAFTNSTSILSDTQANLFEGVQVYAVKGTGKYLMIVEAMGGGGRYFRAFSATSLDGTFTAIQGASSEGTPFAGKNNVTFEGNAWTNDISHGDMVREDPSETQTIDSCKMQFLYQGRDPNINVGYGDLPYRPGLLTKTN